MSGAWRAAAVRAAAALALCTGLTATSCSGEPGSAVVSSADAVVTPQGSVEATQLASHKQLLLEDEPASCSVSLGLDALGGVVHAEVALTVVAPDGRRTASYDFEPQARALEGREPLQLGVGASQEEAVIMYELAPDAGGLWADVMAGRATLAFTRVQGTPEERVGGW